MTRVDIFRDKLGFISKFECNGHSEYSEEGSDIVCASVTSVIYAAMNGIEKVLGINFGYEQGDGYIFCVMPEDLSEIDSKHINILLESMFLFLKELEKQYPDNVSVSELEV